jgi:hypothetical protein
VPAVGWGSSPQDRRWGSILSRVLWNIHSVALGSTQPLTEISTKGFPWCKARPALTVDSSAVLVVPNVNIGMEAQHSIPGLSLCYLLQVSFTFISYSSRDGHCFLPNSKSRSFLVSWHKMPICCYSYAGINHFSLNMCHSRV